MAALVLLRKEFHGVVDSLEFASRELSGREDVRSHRPGRWHRNRVQDPPPATFSADVRIGDELHAFSLHLFKAAIDDVLFQLEFRDAVAEQSADAVCFFVDRDRVAGAA